ncbi:trehalose 6-phosphate phosphatase [Actinoplanes lutulentus]|uniref:Trehalose 6-phosphate phosphatase n=1 Tax=Actinoplanes lutulentus TaxID=1287878 RepID=A0A327Z6C8_9ACTN|nr:trehalose-phosphatase [Actinoplanes lutulentus]MBB2946057.1 trehalose 6-phosphate phosphatase [Actinoplanes lutulentus]RAK32747.1 trehalose 6-phosphatase [Actinoplanes lutulentus]
MAEIARPTHPLTTDEAWAFTAARASSTTFFFDFDGVLSPVTDDPDDSQPVPAVLGVLEQLASVVARVAIVSARPVSFLRSRFETLEGVDLYGLYGLEVWHDGQVVTEPAALEFVPTMSELAERARTELPAETLVEYKRLSVALHYRTAPDLAKTVERWGHEQAERLGLRIQNGRMVVELKPPVDQDKGMVITEGVRNAGCAWYFGDDMSDIKAFDALRAREAVDPRFFGMAVAVANPETGAEVSSAADLTLDSPEAVAAFLAEGLHRFK